MELNILVTGLQYKCKDEADLKTTMEHLTNEKPKVCMVKKTTHDYGIVVEVKERRKVRGVVSRFDLNDVLELMRLSGYGVLTGVVSSVVTEGGYMFVKIKTPEDFVSDKASKMGVWDSWSFPNIPLISDIKGREEIESTICYLDGALHNISDYDTATIVDCLGDLIDLTRYDVTLETQRALKHFRRLIEKSDDADIHATLNKLVHAINKLGSQKRASEFDDVFYQGVYESEEARDMVNNWYGSFVYLNKGEKTIDDIRREKLEEIERNLQTLPEDLYYVINDKGMLFHRLLYLDIPYEKFRGLMSALIMRDHLLDELEDVEEYDCADVVEEEKVELPVNLQTDEARTVLCKLQRNGWLDERMQPIGMNRGQKAVLAHRIAEELGLKKVWVLFETLWGENALTSSYQKAINQKKTMTFIENLNKIIK